MKRKLSPVVARARELREIVSREYGNDLDKFVAGLMERQRSSRKRKRGKGSASRKR